jgi:hypothetical protein
MGNQPGATAGNKSQASKLEQEAQYKAIKLAVQQAKDAAIKLSQREAYSQGNPGLPPKQGEFVYTPFGPGVVEEYRPESQTYVVVQAWRLDQDAKVFGYFHVSSVFKVEPNNPNSRIPADTLFANILPNGLRVDTNYGKGEIDHFDVNRGTYKVVLDWELDGGIHSVVYAQPEIIRVLAAAKKGDYVLTPYGTGTLKDIRSDGIHIVTLNQLTGGSTGYLSATAIEKKLKAVVGQKVMTVFGPGVVIRYRREDDIYIVSLEFALSYINEEAIIGPLQGELKSPQNKDCLVQ